MIWMLVSPVGFWSETRIEFMTDIAHSLVVVAEADDDGVRALLFTASKLLDDGFPGATGP
jgi:hypothetical protein